MNESELLRELSRKTGLPESAAELILRAERELVHDGVLDPAILTVAQAGAAVTPLLGAGPKLPIIAAKDPKDPSLVEELIARAKRHPLGLEFLLSGLLASVAIALGAHAFTVEAARARLRREQAAELQETTVP